MLGCHHLWLIRDLLCPFWDLILSTQLYHFLVYFFFYFRHIYIFIFVFVVISLRNAVTCIFYLFYLFLNFVAFSFKIVLIEVFYWSVFKLELSLKKVSKSILLQDCQSLHKFYLKKKREIRCISLFSPSGCLQTIYPKGKLMYYLLSASIQSSSLLFRKLILCGSKRTFINLWSNSGCFFFLFVLYIEEIKLLNNKLYEYIC